MPSSLHEVLVSFFRARPLLAAELLAVAQGLTPLGPVEGAMIDTDLSEAVPAEYRADAAILLRGAVELALVIGVQLHPDKDKKWSWPAYLALTRARQRCPAAVLVLTLDPSTARWAAEPITLGPDAVMRPIVMGPAQVPLVIDPAQAQASPELAVLSVIAHGGEPEVVEVGRVAIDAIANVDESRKRLYTDLIFEKVAPDIRRILKEYIMERWEPRSEFLRELNAEARAEARAEALVEGEARGVAIGEVRGRSVAVELLRGALQDRFGVLTPAQEARLQRASLDTLQRWGRSVFAATSIDAALQDSSEAQ
jgi:hypothetical protein